MSVILRLGAVNTDTPYSTLISDGGEYESPIDMSPVADDPYTSPPQTYPGCFGLPYQDHNYGAPPPPTPPQTPPPPAPPKETLDYKEEIVVTTDVPSQLSPLPKVQEDDLEDPTRCICDFIHDDGYMIQCDKCSVWQHIACMGLDRDSIPDTYLCEECHPRPVDRARAREFQIRKREFLKTLLITSHDSSTDTDPEEVNNRLKAYGLDPSAQNGKPKQKVKVKKRKERMNSKTNNKKLKEKEFKIEKENTNKEANKRNKLLVKDFSSKVAKAKKEKLSKKIEKMRAERLSKEMKEDKFSSEDLREDEKIINTLTTITAPLIQDENAQNPWDISSFNEWEQSYEVARYNQYTTYVQEYLNSTCINGHHNDIADLVTDGLRVQRCRIKELKNKKKGLEASCTIPDGQPVIEVIGKVMTRQQYDKDNFGQRQLSPFVFFYGKVFDLDLVIDASDYGNDARFIRRSCQPNAVVHHVVAGGQAHFIAVATKEVLEGTEITIPFDYDYKKWNFCVECACLRNNCPVSRYQKRRLRFQKLQINPSPNKKLIQHGKAVIKSPVKSPTKSPVKTTKSPEKKKEVESPTPETIHVSEEATTTTTPSPTKMVRRSQVPRQNSNNASTQVSSGRVRSLRVPSQASDTESTPVDPVTTPEPTALRSSEVDALTSPESHPNKEKDSSTDTQQQEQPKTEKKKLTREERKMEAIMKAFEKMEKRNARKASVDQVKQKEKKEEKDEKIVVKKDIKKEKEKEPTEPVVKVKEEPVKVEETVEPPPPAVVVEKKEVKCEVEEVVEVRPEVQETKEEEVARPTLRERPPPKGKRAKKTASRRRTRNSSGASVSMEIKVEPAVEEDTSSSTCTSLPPPVTSCPATPVPVQEEITVTPPSFRFLKTKRHLMNEWLHEKETDVKPPAAVGARSEPLEVSVGEESMFVTCLPSPRNSMDRLRRNSQSSRDHRAVAPTESTGGSAKKRWLRQAMGEGSESGTCSPVLGSGGMSPNPQTMHSPGGSPPIDFVTPLKKRRLARESLSRDSVSSESATPSPNVAATSSYFAGLTETFEAKMENFRSKNGFNAAFSPIRPPSVSESVTDINGNPPSGTAASSESQCDSVTAANSTDSLGDQPSSKCKEENHPVVDDKDHVSSCAEIDCSDTCNTGIEVSPSTGDAQISNMEVRSTSSGPEEERRENCEQILVCDLEQSANSEPDSSVSVCQSSATTAMEVECDSVSTETSHSVAMEVMEEVDSTERNETVTEPLHTTGEVVEQSVASDSQQASEDNDQCDSCNSERIDSAEDSKRQMSETSPSLASSSTGTSRLITGGSAEEHANEPSDSSTSDSSKVVADRLPQVGSSTDQRAERSNSISESVSGSVSLQQATESNVSIRTECKFVSQHDDGNEAINSTEDSVSTNVSPNSSRTVTLREPLSTSHLSPELSPVPNRHLKFLQDSHFTEMTVDSTTHSHFLSTVGTSNTVNSSGIHNLSYDSDSMDVTSASDVGINGGLEDGRKSEDSLTSFPESSSSNMEPSQPKEKKKVSLQEYLKRKKDKPCGAPTPGPSGKGMSATSNVSSTVTTSPLKLTTPMSLEKLPPLPSLPSLPMFEKTERKEFKSSSEILSPIFNRKEKTEEVRKHMSLSERLRQEFGLDDSTDTDTDTENKSDSIGKGAENHLSDQDVPPPPPPPPPQGQTLRSVALQGKPVPNGNAIPSLLSIKTFPTSGLLKQDPTTSTTAPVAPKMVPPPPGSMKLQPGAAGIPGIITPSAPGKVPIGSPISTSLNTLLSSVKSPAQLQTDLTAQLAALKAQISKVQQALPIVSANNGGASSSSTSVSDQGITPVNGVSTASLAPASYDYGHQGGNNFMRQNSYPSANSSNHYQGFNKTSPSLGFNKSPGFNKVSPRYGKGSTQSGNQPYTNSVNSNGNQYNSAHHQNNISPSSWNQKHSLPHNHTAATRKHYPKQSSHKY